MDDLRSQPSLTPDERAAVLALVADVERADGVDPLNEEAHLALERDEARHWLAERDGVLAGYAHADLGQGTAQLCVHPGRRGAGLGRRLADAVAAEVGGVQVWAFGDLPAARALGASLGLSVGRELLIMARPLPADLGAPPAPADVRITGFTPDATDAFLAVNAAAFAGHPEQGSFSAADLAARQAEPWWDPSGLLLAWDADGLAGFHWTKRHPGSTGEVYVIGVHPRTKGRRLGSTLLQAGLDKLASDGCDRVILYVDGDNARAVELYERSGFAVVHRDVLYASA